MGLYGLTDSELFWEQGSDVKMLMGWNRNTVVVAFRCNSLHFTPWFTPHTPP